MKKRSLKILASVVLILVMLMPYMETIAATVKPLELNALGAAGDTNVIRSTAFLGGDERTEVVPPANAIYDKAGYYKYITSVEGITAPSGAGSGEIYIRDIKGNVPGDETSSFYCLNPAMPFPPAATGTNYTSAGLLSEMNDAQLAALVDKPITVANLQDLVKRFYISESAQSGTYSKMLESNAKDLIIDSLVEPLNTRDKIYQFLTDDDIKVAQQWSLWKEVSNANWGASPLIKRDLNDTGNDDTPLGEAGYKSDRNALMINLANNFKNDVQHMVPNSTTLVTDLTHKFYDNAGTENIDYGVFKLNTTRPDQLVSIRLLDHNGIDITNSPNYTIFIGDKIDMGDNYAIPLTGTLIANFKSAAFLNRNFFLRFNNPADVLGVKLEVTYLHDSIVDAEIFTSDDGTHQNIIKIVRNPVIGILDDEYLRPDSVTDLALRKFISEINGVAVDTREPNVSYINEAIEKSTRTTAHYAHKKNPLLVKHGDTVTYKMRIYNESTQEGHLISVHDILPAGLSLKTGAGINNNWTVVSNLPDGRTVIKYEEPTSKLIFGAVLDGDNNYNMYYYEISVDIVIDSDAPAGIELTNIAFINAQEEADIDSRPGPISKDGLNDLLNIPNSSLPSYRGYGNDSQTLDQPTWYYQGYEDDDDFEKVIIQPFDLALRKFITNINGTAHDRAPVVDVTKLANGTATTATYTHPKNPLQVEIGDIVTYKIRVYNEGGLAGYAKQIKDHLPSGLGYVINHRTNLLNGWEQVGTKAQLTDAEKLAMPFLTRVDLSQIAKESTPGDYSPSENATSAVEIDIVKGDVVIMTEIMANHLLESFNSALGADGLKYVDVEVVSIVLEDLSGMNLRNWAEISEDADENNNPVTDRDSDPNNLVDHPNGPFEDDEDYEDLMTEYFDLALRKFITNVNDDADPNTSGDAVDREPRVDVTQLINETATTATYSHPKTPVEVQKGDLVTYRIRVYNEGMIDGYVKEIKDHLPKGLAFLPQHTKNIDNGWEIVTGTDATAADYPGIDFKFRSTDLQGVTDLNNTILAINSPVIKTKVRENHLLPKFDSTRGVEGLSYTDVEIVAVVLEDRELDSNKAYIGNLKNWAEISQHSNADGNPIVDRDSDPNNFVDHPNGPYEDDEDFEDLTTKPLRFDLALQKFITQIISTSDARAKTSTQLADRVPKPVIDSNNKITYTKDNTEPPLVGTGDTVIYTIRVYNEGDIAGYATQVRDTIPEGLTYLPNHAVNQKHEWYFIDADGNVVTDIADAKYIETKYLSRDKAIERENASEQPDRENTILKAFDKATKTIHARDVQIAFQVNEKAKPGANNLKNIAEISEDEDEEGNPVDDDDSTPGNDVPTEDDIDDEDLKVTYFDLALLKIVTNVELTENGKTRNIPTKHTFEMIPEPVVKTDLDERYLDKTQIKYTYKIRVYNEGLVEGYATKVADYIPKGLEFYPEDQKKNTWTKVEDGLVETTDLADVLLKPGEFATVEIVLRWINHRNNMGVKTNVAEISEDHNEYDLPDIDSIPGNRKPGEDDIDDASVIVAIRTGAAATFFTISLTMAIIVGAGTILIKRYAI